MDVILENCNEGMSYLFLLTVCMYEAMQQEISHYIFAINNYYITYNSCFGESMQTTALLALHSSIIPDWLVQWYLMTHNSSYWNATPAWHLTFSSIRVWWSSTIVSLLLSVWNNTIAIHSKTVVCTCTVYTRHTVWIFRKQRCKLGMVQSRTVYCSLVYMYDAGPKVTKSHYGTAHLYCTNYVPITVLCPTLQQDCTVSVSSQEDRNSILYTVSSVIVLYCTVCGN